MFLEDRRKRENHFCFRPSPFQSTLKFQRPQRSTTSRVGDLRGKSIRSWLVNRGSWSAKQVKHYSLWILLMREIPNNRIAKRSEQVGMMTQRGRKECIS